MLDKSVQEAVANSLHDNPSTPGFGQPSPHLPLRCQSAQVLQYQVYTYEPLYVL